MLKIKQMSKESHASLIVEGVAKFDPSCEEQE
jgi:hypothetical protein